MTILSSFSDPHVVRNLYAVIFPLYMQFFFFFIIIIKSQFKVTKAVRLQQGQQTP